MKTLVIPSQNDIGAYLNQPSGQTDSSPADNCQCGLRRPLTEVNPESTPCDAERQPNPRPNDPPFTFDIGGLFNRLFDQAKIITPGSQGQPYQGMENRPHGIMQPDQFIFGRPDNSFRPHGSNDATNTTTKRWISWRQPAHQTVPAGQIRRPFVNPKRANPKRPTLRRNPSSWNPCVGHTPATPISHAGGLVASGGSESLLFLDLYSTGHVTPSQTYPYAGAV